MRMLNKSLYAVMMDIDGTIKDLVQENNIALINAMKAMDRVDLRLRGKLVLQINKLNMFVKTGLLPTNKFMQGVLLLIYSILLLKRYTDFENIYFKEYNKEDIWFDGVDNKLEDLYNNGTSIYLVTKNTQNENIVKDSAMWPSRRFISKLIIGKRRKIKYYLYKQLVDELGISKHTIVIIGDNFWDDILSALILGVNVIWCNMYNSKLKKFAISILEHMSKRVLSSDSVKKF